MKMITLKEWIIDFYTFISENDFLSLIDKGKLHDILLKIYQGENAKISPDKLVRYHCSFKSAFSWHDTGHLAFLYKINKELHSIESYYNWVAEDFEFSLARPPIHKIEYEDEIL